MGGIDWAWLAGLAWLMPALILAGKIAQSARMAAKYCPKVGMAETSLLAWWGISLVTLTALVVMLVFGRARAKIAAGVLLAAFATGVTLNYVVKSYLHEEVVEVESESWVGLHLTDFHAGPFVGDLTGQIEYLVKKAQERQRKIKYVFLTGDYLGLRSNRATWQFRQQMKRLRQLLPEAIIFACVGAHEVEFQEGRLESIFKESGIKWGLNVWIPHGEIAVWCGDDTDWPGEEKAAKRTEWRQMMVEGAKTPAVRNAKTRIVLWHDPDDTDEESAREAGIDLILCGHTHTHDRRMVGPAVQLRAAGFGPSMGELNGCGCFPIRICRRGANLVVAQHRSRQRR